MISYKLAKKLKEAGFPRMKEKNPFKKGEVGYKTWEKGYLCPTLSELIEACGEDFVGLEYYLRKKKWVAIAEVGEFVVKIYEEWKSPDEAVAKLWLKLNDQPTNT